MIRTNSESTTARHPVADLLTDEMRARVETVVFVHHHHLSFVTRVLAKYKGRWCCPLAVATDRAGVVTPADVIYAIDGDFHRLEDDRVYSAISDFIDLIDDGRVDPENVHAMLGIDARPLPASQTDATEAGG